MENFAAALWLGGGGAAAWCGPGRACGREFSSILGGDLGLWSRKTREDAGNRSQMVTGGEGGAYAALSRESALHGLPKAPKTRV